MGCIHLARPNLQWNSPTTTDIPANTDGGLTNRDTSYIPAAYEAPATYQPTLTATARGLLNLPARKEIELEEVRA